MQARGLKSLFEIDELSIMGFTGVLRNLPRLFRRIRQTVKDVIANEPDVLLLIDSPEFSYRVARRVKQKRPHIKTIKYVAPSVWAWRPGRAERIATYIDHVLAILPFEPELMRNLGGPETSYVGHPLASEIPDIKSSKRRKTSSPPRLLILPGSRRSETNRLLPFLKETMEILKKRGNEFDITLPAVSRLEPEIRELTRNWPYQVNVVAGDGEKKKAFQTADLALAASGTVTLELALFKVPMISIYKLDFVAMRLRHLLTGWTASLPNLIADYPVVPERFNEYAHPHYVARMVERLCQDGQERNLQLEGFDLIEKRLSKESPDGLVAARKILEIATRD